MSLPSWLSGLQASYGANRMIDATNYMVIATIEDALPAARTLKFRGFEGTCLSFYMDQRSRLFENLNSGGPCELLWQFSISKETYRIACNQISLGSQEQVDAIWETLTKKEKEEYVGPVPDRQLDPVEDRKLNDIDSYNPQEITKRSGNFAVVHLHPRKVEYTRQIDKSAIGNTRKTYESLPQPEQKVVRFLQYLNEEGAWETQSLTAN